MTFQALFDEGHSIDTGMYYIKQIHISHVTMSIEVISIVINC